MTPAAPELTILAVHHLFTIENVLRELIITELYTVAGPRWYNLRLPGDVLKKYKEGIAYERSLKWIQLIPHHPIYYVDFPDLRKVITRADNWDSRFRTIFGNQLVLESTLGELEYVRNKVAHNRLISHHDLTALSGAYDKLVASIGEARFAGLLRTCTCASSLPDVLARLVGEIDSSFKACHGTCVCAAPTVWTSISNEWWFDDLYLDHHLDGIRHYFSLVSEYRALPRTRGEGHRIEEWLSKADLQFWHHRARSEAQALIREEHGNGSHGDS